MSSKRPDQVLDIFLGPGDFHFGDRETCIRTLLGSCVSFVLWHPQRYIGGMCHYMLPSRGRKRNGDEPLDGKYADEAMQLMLAEVSKCKTRVHEYRVHIFGGGDMFPGLLGIPERSVAARNIATATELVRRLGLKVEATHVGETGHRQVIFELWSGRMWVKHLKRRLKSEAA